MRDAFLAQPPTEVDQTVVPQGVKVHQSRLDPLGDAADLLQLPQEPRYPLGKEGHLVLGGHHFRREPLVRARAGGGELELPDRGAPKRVLVLQIDHDAPHQREGGLCLGVGEDAGVQRVES